MSKEKKNKGKSKQGQIVTSTSTVDFVKTGDSLITGLNAQGITQEQEEESDKTLEAEFLEDIHITPDLIEAGAKIAAETCVLEIHVRRPGFTKRIKSDLFLEKSGNNAEVSADILRVSQDIIERKEIQQLEIQRKQLIRYFKGLAIPGGMLTLGGGQYLVPLSRLKEIKDEVISFTERREILLDNFGENYERIKDSAKVKRGGFYDENDYPSFETVRGRYSLDYKFISNSVPEELAKVSQELYEAEKQKVMLDCASAAKEARTAIRESFKELVSGLVDKLSNDEGGQPKTFSKARLKKLQDFVNGFEKLDMTSDNALKTLVEDSKAILTGQTIDTIKDNDSVRDAIKESFQVVLLQTEDLVVKKRRSVDID